MKEGSITDLVESLVHERDELRSLIRDISFGLTTISNMISNKIQKDKIQKETRT